MNNMINNNQIEEIFNIINDVIGAPKSEYGSWRQYNCPHCASENYGIDNRYNCEVSVEEGYFHCWKCGYAGKLYKIVKDYGTHEQYNKYRIEAKRYNEINSYIFNKDNNNNILLDIEEITLPNGFISLINNNVDNIAAEYLKSRGITQNIIYKFNIGYISECDDWKLNNRILIPSYGDFGDLNYWVARDYTNKNKYKVMNPKIDKKSIIFNEYHLNNYEDLTLVEGPFDHIVVPNSIPLLGKTIKGTKIYEYLMNNHKALVNIWLDDDAIDSAFKMYKELNNYSLIDRVKLIICEEGDPSDIYRKYGKSGIIKYLRSAKKLSDYELAMFNF